MFMDFEKIPEKKSWFKRHPILITIMIILAIILIIIIVLILYNPDKTDNTISYDCSSDVYNCGDFSTQSEAQKVFDYCESQGKGDIHRLDSNNDGEACESLG